MMEILCSVSHFYKQHCSAVVNTHYLQSGSTCSKSWRVLANISVRILHDL